MATAKKTAAAGVKTPLKLHEAVAAVVKRHESQAEAARQFGVGKAYLSRLMSGVKENPSDEVLAKMGIRRHASVEYTLMRGGNRPS